MPKETQTRTNALRSPYTRRQQSSCPIKSKDTDEWDLVRCPVCMDHPHNAVLLLCSSHKKGCRAFVCNTSSRHSNCLDQYTKSFSDPGSHSSDSNNKTAAAKLPCPLCRSPVSNWVVDEPARQYMDLKERSCSVESCEFSGVYGELRRHAREEHPTARPSDVDPERQRNWRTMERQRDLGDLLSMLNPETDITGGGNNNEVCLDLPGTTDLNVGPPGQGSGSGSLMVFFVGQSSVSHTMLRHRRSFSQTMMQFMSGPRAIVIWGERHMAARNAATGAANDVAVAPHGTTGLTGGPGDNNPVGVVPSPPPLQDDELSDG